MNSLIIPLKKRFPLQKIPMRPPAPPPVRSQRQNRIPPVLYQTWHTKNLPPLMKHAVYELRKSNPNLKHILFDDNDCWNFIKTHFDESVQNAYQSLIPGAYKADLWRYCILYKYGGIYLDIKYIPINNFKLINLIVSNTEKWVLDIDGESIYNALMVLRPNNEVLKRAIDMIVENVRGKFYGSNDLEPTGPKLLCKFFTKEEIKKLPLKHFFIDNLDNRLIRFHHVPILKSYPGYLKETSKYNKTPHYSTLWSSKSIYSS